MPDSPTPRWGLAATILAPTPEILRFVAYHLEAGAHRLFIYLDADTPDAYAQLKAHPKVRVQTCDANWWQKRTGRRPLKHQVRQAINATHAYRRRAEVDWLIHMDADEFLVTGTAISRLLGNLADGVRTVRVRPMELLADGDGMAYKAFIPPGPDRDPLVDQLYPTFGRYLRGGFLSHVAGKLFVRTGLPDVSLRIHNAFENEVRIDDSVELTDIDLGHRHAKDWDSWRAAFDYRLEKGAYRAELDPGRRPGAGQMKLHDLFCYILAKEGEAGLRALYEEVVADSPGMRARLNQSGVLRIADLGLDTVAQKHFPDAR